MADDVKAETMLDQLREAFAAQIREAVKEVPAHQALQLADALCNVQLNLLAGLRVSYRKPPDVDATAIAEDWRRGLSVSEIVRKHGISRSLAYKLNPCKTKPAKRG